MKSVLMLVGVARAFDTLLPGRVIEMSDADAEHYIALGYAEPAGVESTIVEPTVERAVKPRARGRG